MAEIGGQTMARLLEQLLKDYTGARERRKERYGAGLGKLQEVAGMYGPGYMAGQEKLALTGAKSALAARGLGGTTRPGAVSAGMKAEFEDVRRQGRTGAMTNIANYMAGFQDIYPEAGTLAHLATGGFSGLLAERGLGLQEYQATTGRLATLGSGGGGGGGYGGGGGTQTPLFQGFTTEFKTPFDRNGNGGSFPSLTSLPSTPGSPMAGYGASAAGVADAVGAVGTTGTMAGVTETQAGGEGDYGSYEAYAAAMRAAGRKPLVRSIWQGNRGISQFGSPTPFGEFGGGLGGKFGGVGATGSW